MSIQTTFATPASSANWLQLPVSSRHGRYAQGRRASCFSSARRAGPTVRRGLQNADAKVAVVGAGPVGVFTALVLARRGFRNIRVFDRLPEPPAPADVEAWGDVTRSYNLGLGGRGQTSLTNAGAMERVDKWSLVVRGRKDWPSGGGAGSEPRTTMTTRKYLTKVIARDRLTSCLLEELREKHPEVCVQFNIECVDVTFSKDGPVELQLQHRGSSSKEGREDVNVEVADWIVGADGVTSTVRSKMKATGAKSIAHRFEDRRGTVYRTLPIPVRDGDPVDFNLSVRNGDVGIEALPDVDSRIAGVVLFPPDSRMAKCTTGADMRQLFEELFPAWPTPLLSDETLETFASRPNAKLPQFSYCGPELHWHGQAVLVGDSIHSVKPYFGLGVNSAFEDVMVLDKCIEYHSGDIAKAFVRYSSIRASDAKVMVESQYSLDQPDDIRFFLFFILPLLLDNQFHAAFPQFCSPNIIAMLQNEQYSFTEAKRKKDQDRLAQVTVLTASGAAIIAALRSLASSIGTDA